MTITRVEDSAAALYDGGWRAEDFDELAKEYNLTPEEAGEICSKLKAFEDEATHAQG